MERGLGALLPALSPCIFSFHRFPLLSRHAKPLINSLPPSFDCAPLIWRGSSTHFRLPQGVPRACAGMGEHEPDLLQ